MGSDGMNGILYGDCDAHRGASGVFRGLRRWVGNSEFLATTAFELRQQERMIYYGVSQQ